MSALKLLYPVKPHIVNRGWGVKDPVYEQFGFSRHNGVDLALAHGQLILAPFGCRVVKVGCQPGGSGNYICLLSKEAFEFQDGIFHVEITFMHLLDAIAREGDDLVPGNPIARGDSTGFSTGNHTHMAPKRVRVVPGGYIEADHNDAKDTFDPEPFWSGEYAEMKVDPTLVERIKNQISALTKMVAELRKKLV